MPIKQARALGSEKGARSPSSHGAKMTPPAPALLPCASSGGICILYTHTDTQTHRHTDTQKQTHTHTPAVLCQLIDPRVCLLGGELVMEDVSQPLYRCARLHAAANSGYDAAFSQ